MSFQHPPEWFDKALCAEVGGDLWFPEKGGSTKKARSVCQRCEVQEPCLTYAMDSSESYGIWGGATTLDREKMAKKRW